MNMDYVIGEQVLTDTGQTLEYIGDGKFRNAKTGLTLNALQVTNRIKYRVVGNAEEPLGLPSLGFGDEPVVNAEDDSPLGLPVMEF